MNNALIIFIKNIEEGNVKTRLVKTIGIEKAMQVYKFLLHHTKTIAKNVHADKFLFYSSFINNTDDWKNDIFKKNMQNGNDLGLKMQHAFETVFAEDFDKVCIIGSDCIELTTDIIEQSFAELNKTDVVIGPAKDGGYYLLAIKQIHKRLFENITWSTEHVLNETISICRQLKLSYFLLKELTDVDEEKDLQQFKERFSFLNTI